MAPGVSVADFMTSSNSAWIYIGFNGPAMGDSASVNFIRPDGTVHQTSLITFGGQSCFAYPLNIGGTEAASYPGNWTVQPLWNSTIPLFSLPFTITAQ